MIGMPQCKRHYASAKKRFLHGMLDQFFKNEFQKLFGPIMRERIVQEIVTLVDAILPKKEYLRPGQIIWNAVSIDTRPDHPQCKFVPVVLTLIDEDDIEALCAETKMSTIAKNAIARINLEAEQQGAYLSMRDIGLFGWRQNSRISQWRKQWEIEHDKILPHVGSKQDIGTCISHKSAIIKKIVFEKQDPRRVAHETKHSMKAVDSYLTNFNRVKTCYQHTKDIEFITQVTALSKNLVNQYIKMVDEYEKKT